MTITVSPSVQIDGYIKQRIDHIKEINDKLNLDVSDSNTLITNDILDIVKFLEKTYKDNGMESMIDTICTQTIDILEKHNLSKHISLAYKVIPEQYKDSNKNGYKNLESKIIYQKFNRNFTDISSLDLDKMDDNAIRSAYDQFMDMTTTISEQMAKRNLTILNTTDTFSRLKEMEKNKFKKANIGEPLTTIDEMCQNPDYAQSYEELVLYMDQLIDSWKTIKEIFTQKYIPLSVQTCKDLVEAVKWMVDFIKPFIDRKYRRDHAQMIKMAILKVSETATKASKESRIPCGHHFDKNGAPLFRRITKEQIDSMYVSEFNFILESFNMMFRWYELMSGAATEHYYRAKEDRAVDLSATLSFHA